MRSFLGLACITLSACGASSHGAREDRDAAVGDGDADADGDSDADADADCVDLDRDSVGVGGGCYAQDCDDTDPSLTVECGHGCDADPERTGCACPAGEVIVCYNGPPGTQRNSPCQGGLRTCNEGGTWGGCRGGQVLPVSPVEVACDGVDDDCNGVVDDGVQSACGTCDSECSMVCVGVGCDDPFVADEGQSIFLNPDGTISPVSVPNPNFFIWIPNTSEGTVSKIDTRTREEVGRFITMPTDIARGAQVSPSYTTANRRGDAVVSNRHEQVGGATKILAAGCPDRNHNGIVDTSTGGDDIQFWDEDECVAWYVSDIPAAHGNAFEVRTELDGGVHEYVWVASYSLGNIQGGTIVEIDSLVGEKTGREIEDTPGHAVAMGPDGILWSVALGGCPFATDTTTLEQTLYAGCGGAFGLAIDSEGRPWIGSSTSRLDIEREVWEVPLDANGNPAFVGGNGIAVDASGNAYTGQFNSGDGFAGHKIDGETMESTGLPGMGGHGWSVDRDGFIWSVDMQDSAHVMDPETLEVTHVRPPLVSPQVYSPEMAGPQHGDDLDSSGVYTHTFEICRPDFFIRLLTLEWSADVPEGSAVSFRLKNAHSVGALADAAWIDIASIPDDSSPLALEPVFAAAGVDLSDLGRYVMVEVTLLTADGPSRPALGAISIGHSCFWGE